MLISLRLIVLIVVSVSCLASAFSTLFVTEGVEEARKMEETGTKTPKTEGNNAVEDQMIVETIPFFTDIFAKVEDVTNLTPLKVATIISAQHLINTVKSIPVSGYLPLDALNTLGSIVDQFNKTTQIIKLTAEYVNISSQYMLDSLNQFAKQNCDAEYTKNIMKSINKSFLEVILNHVKVAVQEITKRSENRELTGTDVLVSSAYHIVAAFQEMTNQVMSIKVDSTTCNVTETPTNSEQVNISENSEMVSIFENPKHDATHKSIKKDQALPKPIITSNNRESLRDILTIENLDKNPDLTLEIYPYDPLMLDKKDREPLTSKKIKIPESLKVAFLSDTKAKVKNNELNKQENMFTSHFGLENIENKIRKKNFQNFGDIFSFGSVNPNEEIFSPQDKENSYKEESIKSKTENNQQKLDNLDVYYYPLNIFDKNKNHLLNTNIKNNLKVPEDLRVHYPSQDLKSHKNENTHSEKLKQMITPFKTLSLFGSSDSGAYEKRHPQQRKKYSKTKSEGSQTNFKPLDDTLIVENLNRQDLTVEVFSPEAFMHYGKDESTAGADQGNADLFGMKGIKSSQLKPGDLKKRNSHKTQDHKLINQKNKKLQSLDRELASSAVDSLSNVPPTSYESGAENSGDRKANARKVNTLKSVSTLLTPWGKESPKFQSPLFHSNQRKHSLCDERVEPVCGIDKKKSNFIIFLNDCKRKHHNSVYDTSYEWANMDSCIGFLLKYSSEKPTKYSIFK